MKSDKEYRNLVLIVFFLHVSLLSVLLYHVKKYCGLSYFELTGIIQFFAYSFFIVSFSTLLELIKMVVQKLKLRNK